MTKVPTEIPGILGGMGSAATAEFFRLICDLAPSEKDQNHPRVYILSDPWIPDRTEAIIGNGQDPGPFILEDMKKLALWGASFLVVPCNTAHVFIDKLAGEIPLPLIHIVDATIEEAARRSARGAWLMATIGTLDSGIYQRHAKENAYPLAIPSPELQEKTQEVIRLVKANEKEKAGDFLEDIVCKLREQHDFPVIEVCTELSLARKSSRLPTKWMISSLEALALACINRLYPQGNV
ncbi:MAG: amino acid racemase [Thermotogota bacterium]|nr:amino acid racemase [Thermotogota bacterium]